MLIRFYSIEWQEDSEELPTSVTLDIDDDTDENEIEMMGSDMLEDEFGVEVDSFQWERIDEEEKEDPFSFGTDEE
jgi:hypothetical protein